MEIRHMIIERKERVKKNEIKINFFPEHKNK